MPIYEYHCDPCDHSFETLIRGGGDAARCPRCGNLEVAKQFSVPAPRDRPRSRRRACRSAATRPRPVLRLRPPAMRLGICAFG